MWQVVLPALLKLPVHQSLHPLTIWCLSLHCKNLSTGAIAYQCSKLYCCCASQCLSTSSSSSFLSGALTSDKFGVNYNRYYTMPKNSISAALSCGCGMSIMALTFSWSSLRPSHSKYVWRIVSLSFWIHTVSVFVQFEVNAPYSIQNLSQPLSLSCCYFSVPQTKISPMTFTTPSKSSSLWAIHFWNISGADEMPKQSHFYW